MGLDGGGPAAVAACGAGDDDRGVLDSLRRCLSFVVGVVLAGVVVLVVQVVGGRLRLGDDLSPMPLPQLLLPVAALTGAVVQRLQAGAAVAAGRGLSGLSERAGRGGDRRGCRGERRADFGRTPEPRGASAGRGDGRRGGRR